MQREEEEMKGFTRACIRKKEMQGLAFGSGGCEGLHWGWQVQGLVPRKTRAHGKRRWEHNIASL
jgi:hypothetical protein